MFAHRAGINPIAFRWFWLCSIVALLYLAYFYNVSTWQDQTPLGYGGFDGGANNNDGHGVNEDCSLDEAGVLNCVPISHDILPGDGGAYDLPFNPFIPADESPDINTQPDMAELGEGFEASPASPEETDELSNPFTSPDDKIDEPVDLPTGILPNASQFAIENGTNWKIEFLGNISFTGDLAEKNLVGDKCRSSKLGDRIIWNCGDMWCDFDYTICGFAMGPAMYGTEDVMTINTTGITHIYNNDFLQPYSDDPEPEPPSQYWGMDTSNVAAINDTHGVAYGYEVWRGTGVDVPRGNAVASITLGDDKPIATRMGPLLTGPDTIQLGLLAILRDEDHIYIYSSGGPSGLIITRVPASDDVFDPINYESLEFNHSPTATPIWTQSIPHPNTTTYGMTTTALNERFNCLVYGSVFYSNYFLKYVILCNIYMIDTSMYFADTPWGPWSEEYPLLSGWEGYGTMAHPNFSPNGSHKEFYFSQGPNSAFHMFKVTFDYDD